MGTQRKEEMAVVCVPEAGMLRVGIAVGSQSGGKPSPGEMVLIAALLCRLPELESELGQSTGPASTPSPCSEHPAGSKQNPPRP